ncbi:hypothetical protein INR49_025953 [Caranx melampygus]|nr:hypothetical protein INR49_025953 [Caranx melampygus]
MMILIGVVVLIIVILIILAATNDVVRPYQMAAFESVCFSYPVRIERALRVSGSQLMACKEAPLAGVSGERPPTKIFFTGSLLFMALAFLGPQSPAVDIGSSLFASPSSSILIMVVSSLNS